MSPSLHAEWSGKDYCRLFPDLPPQGHGRSREANLTHLKGLAESMTLERIKERSLGPQLDHPRLEVAQPLVVPWTHVPARKPLGFP